MGQKVKKGQIIADGAATQQRRAGAGPQRARRVHVVGRLQLRGRHHHQRTAGEERHLHLDPHRGVRHRDPRDEAGQGRVHPRHSERLAQGAGATSTSTASSASAPSSSPATSSSARCRRRSQERADAGREAAARDLRPGRRGREERQPRSAVRRRGHRHRHAAVQPAGEHDRGREEGTFDKEQKEIETPIRQEDRRAVPRVHRGPGRRARQEGTEGPEHGQAARPGQGRQDRRRAGQGVQARQPRHPQPGAARRRRSKIYNRHWERIQFFIDEQERQAQLAEARRRAAQRRAADGQGLRRHQAA